MVVNGGCGWNESLAKGALVRAGAYYVRGAVCSAVKVREPLSFEFSLKLLAIHLKFDDR